MLTYHKVEQGSPEWHALRIGLITASNAMVLLTKGKNAARGTAGSHGSGFWAERGKILEREAIEIYETVYGVESEAFGFITNEEFPESGYSPDNVVVKLLRPLEVKCFKEEKHLACIAGDIPNEVIAQIQYGLMVTGWDLAHLINYNPDIEDSEKCFHVTPIARDELIIARFKEKLGIGGTR